jgi:hypothetical protein
MKTLASTRPEAADCLFQTGGSLCGQPLRLETQSLPQQDRPRSNPCRIGKLRHVPALAGSPLHDHCFADARRAIETGRIFCGTVPARPDARSVREQESKKPCLQEAGLSDLLAFGSVDPKTHGLGHMVSDVSIMLTTSKNIPTT